MKYILIFMFISLPVMADFRPELSQLIESEINNIGDNLVESKILDEDKNILTSFSILSDLSVGVGLPYTVSLVVTPILYLKWTRPTNQ